MEQVTVRGSTLASSGSNMKRKFCGVSCASVLPAMFLLMAGARSAASQTYKAEAFTSPPPQEVAADVRATLSENGVRVTGASGPLCEIWWRKEVPAQANASQGLGILYGQFAEGTLLGAIRFPAEVSDYRQQHIKSGVYTLRYGLIPVDGNHQGVAPNRDFLLLSPAGADSNSGAIPVKSLIDLSRKASGTGHPSVWSLIAADSAPAVLPGLVHQEDSGNWVLYSRIQLQKGGASLSPLPIALVIVGHAAEA